MQWTDVSEGLESTLMVLADRIPPEVRVLRDFGAEVPRIQAAAAELNQVWTNLVDNALHALAERGTLRVSTRPDGRGGVFVEIGDTGTGMSAEARRTPSTRSSRPEPSGRASASAWTSPAASSSGTAGRSSSTAPRARPCCRVRLPSGGR